MRRLVAIDHMRLGHVFGAEEHEMGHAFSLGHLCHEGARDDSNTNIMTQREACPGGIGREGNRSIGFNRRQTEAILKYARELLPALKAYRSSDGVRNGSFEDMNNFEWNYRACTSNARTGKYSLWVENRELSQKIFIKRPGKYEIVYYYNSHGPDNRALLKVDCRKVAEEELSDGGGYGKPFRKGVLTADIRRKCILEIAFKARDNKLWVDDVAMTMSER